MDPSTTPTIEFTEERLGNGLRVILSEDHLAPVVAVNLWYDVGSRHEEQGKTGLAHLFEHMMFQGSANVAKGEHFKLVEAAGGTLNASTWLHRTNYFESGPSNHLEVFLWLEADRMGGLLEALGQETLDNQRDVVKNEKRQRYDNAPYGTWWLRMTELLFPDGHPYHHATIGSMEDLSAATVEDCHRFFRTYYAPNNAVLSIVGDFESGRALEWVERYFGSIPAAPTIPPAPDATIPLDLGGEVREQIPDNVPLPRVFVGFRAPAVATQGIEALHVASALLAFSGGSSGSRAKGTRLYRRLVRERLAQDVEFSTQEFPGVSVAGGSVTLRPEVPLDLVERRFFEVVESLATEPPSEEEMQRARAAMERALIQQLFLRVSGRADALSAHATVYGDPAELNRRLPALLRVTPEQVQRVAREVLRPENRVVLVFVPQDAT